MYPTTEVRWFFAGNVPPAIDGWFRCVGRDPTGGRRIDHYLWLPDVETLGVKWREGRIEVKRRVADDSSVEFAPELAGAVGRWHKWSFGLSDTHALATIRAAEDWVAVTKNRRLHTYAVSDASVQNVPSGVTPQQGCELEMTTVQAAGQPWWTLGFEAFGDEATQRERLNRTVQYVTEVGGPLDLPAEASASYPRWLAAFLVDEA